MFGGELWFGEGELSSGKQSASRNYYYYYFLAHQHKACKEKKVKEVHLI